MRERYDYLSEQTKATFENNVKAIADGWNKSERHIYKILSEDSPDFFPAFYSQYIGVLKGGVSTCHYDNEMEYARFRYGNRKSVKDATECFRDKLNIHAQTMTKYIEYIADGHLSESEIKDLEMSLDREEQNIQMIRTMLNFKKDLIENGRYPKNKPAQNNARVN